MIQLAGASESTVALGIAQLIISLLFLNIDWLCLDVALSVSVGGSGRRGCSCSSHSCNHLSRISVDDVAGRLVDREVSVIRVMGWVVDCGVGFRACGCGGDV